MTLIDDDVDTSDCAGVGCSEQGGATESRDEDDGGWMEHYNRGMMILNSQLIDNSNFFNSLTVRKRNEFALFLGYWVSTLTSD